MEQKAYPTYLQSLGLILILFLFAIPAALLVMPFYPASSTVGISFVYLSSMLCTIISATVIRQDYSFRLNNAHLHVVVVGVITIIAFHLVTEPLVSLLPVPESLEKMFGDIGDHPILLFMTVVVIAPVLEELLFRGIILEGLSINYGNPKALIFSSLLFAFVHGNLAQGIGAFFIGLICGWIYIQTQSIIPCILIHLLNNALPFVFMQSGIDFNKDLDEIIGNATYYWSLIIVGGLITIGGVSILHKMLSARD